MSAGHKQAGINEWQESNIYAKPRVPKAGVTWPPLIHGDDFLLHECCRNQWHQEGNPGGRTWFVVAIYRGKKRGCGSTVFTSVLIYCLLCLCTQRTSLLFCKALNYSCTRCKLLLQIICHKSIFARVVTRHVLVLNCHSSDVWCVQPEEEKTSVTGHRFIYSFFFLFY